MTDNSKKEDQAKSNKYVFASGMGIWLILFILIVIWISISIILYLVRPVFILTPDNKNIDLGKIALIGLILALLSIILIWIVLSCKNCGV